jgi:hypothetical protein
LTSARRKRAVLGSLRFRHVEHAKIRPDDFTRMRPAIEAIGRDVRAELIVKSTLVESSSVASQAP